MREAPTSSPSWPYFLAALAILAIGMVLGANLFPRVEQVVVNRIVERRVEVPVVRVVEKRVEVPVGKVDRLDSLGTKSASARRVWPEIREGLSRSEVREMLGSPGVIDDHYGVWYYANSGWVRFDDGVVSAWKEPSR